MQSDSPKATQQASSRAECWGQLTAQPTSYKIPCYQGRVTALRCSNQRLLQAVKLTTIQGEYIKNNQSIKTVGNVAINPVTAKINPVKVLQ